MPVSIEGLGSGVQHALAIAVELHEHQVPDLDVASALAAELAVGVSGASLAATPMS
jgi:pyruvate/oxaloacetate carboxyltransferase